MGVMKRFDQRLEALVNGTFAKLFKSRKPQAVRPLPVAIPQPLDLSVLTRAMER